MLHKETVDISTLDLLIQLQAKEYLKGFHLVEGTAIALRIGHRKSFILAHRYPLVKEPVTEEHITMLSFQDILAMKLNAITTSGQRVKDFIDVYYLLREFSLSEMISFYKTKYKQYNEVNVLKSITYFDDVDLSDWPQMIDNPLLKWDDIKKSITNATKNYIRHL